MPAHERIQSGSRRAKRHGPRVLAGGAAAVVIVLSAHCRARSFGCGAASLHLGHPNNRLTKL